MKIHKIATQKVNVLDAVVCDKCKTRVESDDAMELQEFLHVSFTGGYSSVFGDMTPVSGDFCQNCVKELLGPWLRLGKPPF